MGSSWCGTCFQLKLLAAPCCACGCNHCGHCSQRRKGAANRRCHGRYPRCTYQTITYMNAHCTSALVLKVWNLDDVGWCWLYNALDWYYIDTGYDSQIGMTYKIDLQLPGHAVREVPALRVWLQSANLNLMHPYLVLFILNVQQLLVGDFPKNHSFNWLIKLELGWTWISEGA